MTTLKRFFAAFLLATIFIVPAASAQNSILPRLDPEWEVTNKKPCIASDPKDPNVAKEFYKNYGQYYQTDEHFMQLIEDNNQRDIDNYLACFIKTGHVRIWMIPFLIKGILNFLIGLGGLISVLMILVGAYYYIIGGLSDDKEKGKNIITYAIGGLVLTILSWTLVNFVLLILTT